MGGAEGEGGEGRGLRADYRDHTVDRDGEGKRGETGNLKLGLTREASHGIPLAGPIGWTRLEHAMWWSESIKLNEDVYSRKELVKKWKMYHGQC